MCQSFSLFYLSMKKKTTVWIQHSHYIKLFPFWTFHNSVYPLIVQNCFKPGGSNHVNHSLKAFTRIWHINDCLKVARFEYIDVPLRYFKQESPRHVPVEVLIWIVWPINAWLLSWAQTQYHHKHDCSWIHLFMDSQEIVKIVSQDPGDVLFLLSNYYYLWVRS